MVAKSRKQQTVYQVHQEKYFWINTLSLYYLFVLGLKQYPHLKLYITKQNKIKSLRQKDVRKKLTLRQHLLGRSDYMYHLSRFHQPLQWKIRFSKQFIDFTLFFTDTYRHTNNSLLEPDDIWTDHRLPSKEDFCWQICAQCLQWLRSGKTAVQQLSPGMRRKKEQGFLHHNGSWAHHPRAELLTE